MTTTRDLITLILRRAGAISGHDTPSADESNDALEMLNGLIDSWANESLLVFSRVEESFPMTGAREYTVGIGQSLDTVPFTNIIAVYARQGTIDHYMESLSDEDYARIMSKDEQNPPQYYNYNNGYPVAKLKLYPKPDASWTLFVVSEKPLSNLALDDEINLPPGWKRALINCGAVEICPDYNLEPSQSLFMAAKESKAAIKTQITKARSMDWPKPGVSTRNIYSGYWH